MRFAKAAATATVFAVALAGCGSKDTDTKSTPAKADPAKIVVWQMGTGSPEQTKFLDGVKAEFQQQHPRTDVQIQYVPFPQATQKFQTALAAGSGGPDVTEVGNTDVQSWIEQGAFADLTDRMNGWAEAKDLNKGALANDQADGKTYAAPWYGGVRGIWYHKDWFTKLGIQVPTSWQSLVAAAKTIQEKKHVPGIAAPSDFTNGILSFVWANGGDVAVKQSGKWVGTLDQPQAKEAIQFYAGLVTTGVAPDKYVGKNELQGPQQDFALGKVGMYMDGSWALPQMQKINKKDAENWGVFPIPGKTGGLAPVFSGGSDLAVWKDSKNQDVAFDYLKILDSKKNAQAFASTLKFLPQFTDVLQSTTYTNDPVMGPFAKAAASGVKFTPTSKGWADFEGAKKVVPTAVKAIMQGKNPDAELKKADEQADSLLNE